MDKTVEKFMKLLNQHIEQDEKWQEFNRLKEEIGSRYEDFVDVRGVLLPFVKYVFPTEDEIQHYAEEYNVSPETLQERMEKRAYRELYRFEDELEDMNVVWCEVEDGIIITPLYDGLLEKVPHYRVDVTDVYDLVLTLSPEERKELLDDAKRDMDSTLANHNLVEFWAVNGYDSLDDVLPEMNEWVFGASNCERAQRLFDNTYVLTDFKNEMMQNELETLEG